MKIKLKGRVALRTMEDIVDKESSVEDTTKKYIFEIIFEGTEEQKEDLRNKLTLFTQDYSARIDRGEAELSDVYED